MFQGQHLRKLWTWCWWHSTLTQWKKSVQAPGTPRCSSHMVLVLCVMLQSRSVMVYCKGKLAIWINMAIVWAALLFEWVLQQIVSAHCWRLAQESILEICTNKSSQNCKNISFFSYRASTLRAFYTEISSESVMQPDLYVCLQFIVRIVCVLDWALFDFPMICINGLVFPCKSVYFQTRFISILAHSHRCLLQIKSGD